PPAGPPSGPGPPSRSSPPGRSPRITLPFGNLAPALEDECCDDDHHAQRHTGISHVERGPVVEGDEVGHPSSVPPDDALTEVPDGASEHQSRTDGQRQRRDL